MTDSQTPPSENGGTIQQDKKKTLKKIQNLTQAIKLQHHISASKCEVTETVRSILLTETKETQILISNKNESQF